MLEAYLQYTILLLFKLFIWCILQMIKIKPTFAFATMMWYLLKIAQIEL